MEPEPGRRTPALPSGRSRFPIRKDSAPGGLAATSPLPARTHTGHPSARSGDTSGTERRSWRSARPDSAASGGAGKRPRVPPPRPLRPHDGNGGPGLAARRGPPRPAGNGGCHYEALRGWGCRGFVPRRLLQPAYWKRFLRRSGEHSSVAREVLLSVLNLFQGAADVSS